MLRYSVSRTHAWAGDNHVAVTSNVFAQIGVFPWPGSKARGVDNNRKTPRGQNRRRDKQDGCGDAGHEAWSTHDDSLPGPADLTSERQRGCRLGCYYTS